MYLSVPSLRLQGHHADFGKDLKITFNTKESSTVVPFDAASDHFYIRPNRIVNFDEVSQICDVSEIFPQNLAAVSNSATRVPLQSGRADFWIYDG